MGLEPSVEARLTAAVDCQRGNAVETRVKSKPRARSSGVSRGSFQRPWRLASIESVGSSGGRVGGWMGGRVHGYLGGSQGSVLYCVVQMAAGMTGQLTRVWGRAPPLVRIPNITCIDTRVPCA